jgi:hypothetical protein
MKFFKLMGLALLIMTLQGCAGCQQDMSHMKSSFVGLERHIILYSANGSIIEEWDVRCQVEDAGGTCRFLTYAGKAITISGTFKIEEK